MIVAIEDHFNAGRLQQRPDITHGSVRPVWSRGEERVMPYRHRARRDLPLELGAHEFPLWRAPGRRDVGIQHQDLPVAGREGVVAESSWSGSGPEVIEVGPRVWRLVFVVTRHRMPSRPEDPPRWIEAVAKIYGAALEVREIARQ